MRKLALITVILASIAPICVAQPQSAYLFAHMTKTDYGRLYYSVSTDGLKWRTLNNGKRVFEPYRGHPDITLGHDGRYYLLGNIRNTGIIIWSSPDLIKWTRFADVKVDLHKIPGFTPAPDNYQGAPKMFYDKSTATYIITWHTHALKEDPNEIEPFWASMRTIYVTSRDLKTFSDPKKLFDYEMATIDVIIRKEADTYYAIIKDERYPDFSWPTGKTIRICTAPTLTGPYSRPSAPVSPNFREAPNLIRNPENTAWYLYYEQYPGVSYGMSTAPKLSGPWYDEYVMKYHVPEQSRHGCMIQIPFERYQALIAAFGVADEKE